MSAIDPDRARIFVFAGNRKRALDWLDERGIDLRRDARAGDLVRLIVDADEINFTMAGLAFDLTPLMPASGPLRRAMAERRDRFCWLESEAEFLREARA